MKKKILAVLLLSMCAGLVACGNATESANQEVETEVVEETTEEVEDETEETEELEEEDVEEAEELTPEEMVTAGIEIMYTDRQAAYDLFVAAAEQGNEDAMFLAGYMLDNEGINFNNMDYEKASEYYEMVADVNPFAKMNLGFMYRHGEGVEQDEAKSDAYLDEAFSLINEEMLDELEYADIAYFEYGLLFLHGYGTPRDYEKAIELFSKAAELGSARAMYFIGLLYEAGRGVPQDDAMAMKCFEEALDYYYDAAVTCKIASIYLNGETKEQDYDKAFELFSQAANNGFPTAMYWYGYMWYNGYGTDQDYEIAKEWWEKGAALGDEDCQEALDENF